MVRRWAQQNLLVAQAWAGKHPQHLKEIARISGQRDPVQAQQWISNLASKLQQTEARGEVYAGWVRTDPTAALTAWANDPSQLARDAAQEGLAEWLGTLDTNQAVAFISSSSHSKDLGEFWVRQMVRTDPMKSVATLFNLPDGPLRKDLLSLGGYLWGLPWGSGTESLLMQALKNEPAGPTRQDVIGSLCFGPRGNVTTSFKWLEILRGSADYELVSLRVADYYASATPSELAEQWHQFPPSVQTSCRAVLLKHWREIDEAAAIAWETEHPR